MDGDELGRLRAERTMGVRAGGASQSPQTARYRVVCTPEGHWVGAPITAQPSSSSSSSSAFPRASVDLKAKGQRKWSGSIRFADESGVPIDLAPSAPGSLSLNPGFSNLKRSGGDFAGSPIGGDSEPEPESEDESSNDRSLHEVDIFDLDSLDRSPRVIAHMDEDHFCPDQAPSDIDFLTRTAILSEPMPLHPSGEPGDRPAWGNLRSPAPQADWEEDLQALTGAWIPLGSPRDASPRQILGNRVHWPDGSVSQLKRTRAGTVVMLLREEVLRATIIDQTLVWATGEVWTKVAEVQEPDLRPVRDQDQGLCLVEDDEDSPPRRPPPSRTPRNGILDLSDLLPCTSAIWPLQDTQEEEEWLARKRLTGTVGRLVNYRERQKPAQDIHGLRRTQFGHLVVTALLQDGPAARAGVVAGDRLASIDGRRVNGNLHLRQNILESLEGPVTLVFLGFAGKLQAEVRVRQPDQPRCGLPSAADVVDCSRLVRPPPRLPEAVIFHDAFCSSVMIATDGDMLRAPSDIWDKLESWNESMPGPTNSLSNSQAPSESLLMDSTYTSTILDEIPLGLYELQRDDAKRILKRAMRTFASQPQTLCSV